MSMRILDLSGPVCPMCLYIRQSVGMSCNYVLFIIGFIFFVHYSWSSVDCIVLSLHIVYNRKHTLRDDEIKMSLGYLM
jgi:hypothetical protein